MRATVPSTKPKHLRRGAPFQTTISAYLYKYGGCNKIKFHESSLWWWRWSIKLSISLNIKQNQLGFAHIMGPCLWICMDKKDLSKVCINLQFDRIWLSGGKQYTVTVVIKLWASSNFSKSNLPNYQKYLSLSVFWWCKLYTSIMFYLYS